MMIRTWVPQDIPTVVSVLMELKQHTIWSKHPEITTDPQDYVKWLHSIYLDHQKQVFISQEEDRITAICGVGLETHFFPPHLRHGFEWCLWGVDTKQVSGVWSAAKQWAESRGASFIRRSSLSGNKEHVRWEKL